MSIFQIENATAVLPNEVLHDAYIVVEDGIIVKISQHRSDIARSTDVHGAICMPGIVDSHSDGLETEILPRPGARLPIDFSLRSFEARVRSAGITTLYHGIGFENDGPRSVELAHQFVDAIHDYSHGRDTLIENKVLYRLDARDAAGHEGLTTRMDAYRKHDPKPLVSFEDHTPGQGQYKDPSFLVNWVMRKHNVDFEEAQRQVAVIAAERELIRHNRDIAIPWLTQLAKEGAISLIAHDPASEEDIAEATTWNASIAEFPTTIEAARAAHAAGMRTVCGAPNVLRGGSHSGNVSAAELILLGLCDGLSSDYLPFSMLGAVGTLVSQNVCSLPHAVHLVTAGPAKTMNLQDRGTLEIGQRADITVCSLNGALPKVLSVISAATAGCADALVNGL